MSASQTLAAAGRPVVVMTKVALGTAATSSDAAVAKVSSPRTVVPAATLPAADDDDVEADELSRAAGGRTRDAAAAVPATTRPSGQLDPLSEDDDEGGGRNATAAPSLVAPTPMGKLISTAPVPTGGPGLAMPATSTAGVPKKRKKKERKAVVNYSLSKYPVIKELAQEFGYLVEEDPDLERYDFNLLWTDTILPWQKLVKLQPWQRTNHFPSMYHLTRKVYLGLTMNRMRKVLPEHYTNVPRTWSLRSEKTHFLKHVQSLGNVKRVFILKPNAGCQGRGIVLTKDPINAVEDLESFVAQEYVMRPLLIDKKKFDLRVYVLVTSMRHPSIHIFNDGLVRMCADDYQKPTDENMVQTSMHLTNYAVNKHSENFVFNSDGERGDVGNKRDFAFFMQYVESLGHSFVKLWERVQHLVTKTILSAQPLVAHAYTTCFPHCNDGFTIFEVLGFDILIDEKLKPWLMEVNHTPSFSCDTPLDHRIKHSLLSEVWRIVGVTGQDKMKAAERDRANFERRLMMGGGQPPAASAAGPSGTASSLPPPVQHHVNVTAAPPTSAEFVMSLSSTPSTPVGVPSKLPDAAGNAAAAPTPSYPVDPAVAEIFLQEDRRSVNFQRIYPCSDPEKMLVYDEIMRVAAELAVAPTTASFEARQTELKAEREKRDAEKGSGAGSSLQRNASAQAIVGGSTASSTSTATLLAASSSLGHTTTSSGSNSTALNMGHAMHRSKSGDPVRVLQTTATSAGKPAPAASLPHRSQSFRGPVSSNTATSSELPTGGPKATHSGGAAPSPPPPLATGGAKQPTTTNATAGAAQPASSRAPIASRRDTDKDRRKLEEQTERHRRRMLLGARMNVFQLRDAQIEALAALATEDDAAGGIAALGGEPPGGLTTAMPPRGPPPPLGAVSSLQLETTQCIVYRHIAPQLVAGGPTTGNTTITGAAAATGGRGAGTIRGGAGRGTGPGLHIATVPSATSGAPPSGYHWLFHHLQGQHALAPPGGLGLAGPPSYGGEEE